MQLQYNFEGRIRVVPISVDSEGERDKAISELRRLTGGGLPFLQDMTRGVLFDAQAAGMPSAAAIGGGFAKAGLLQLAFL